MHADRTNRFVLTLFGLLVLLAGAASLTASARRIRHCLFHPRPVRQPGQQLHRPARNLALGRGRVRLPAHRARRAALDPGPAGLHRPGRGHHRPRQQRTRHHHSAARRSHRRPHQRNRKLPRHRHRQGPDNRRRPRPANRAHRHRQPDSRPARAAPPPRNRSPGPRPAGTRQNRPAHPARPRRQPPSCQPTTMTSDEGRSRSVVCADPV